MKKLLFNLLLICFGLIIVTFLLPKPSLAACTTSSNYFANNPTHIDGDIYITWSLVFYSGCSYSYNFTGSVPSGWSYQYSGCTANATSCWKTVPAGGHITVTFKVTRTITATPGNYYVTAKGYPSSGSGDSISLLYIVQKLPTCDTGKTGCTTCVADSGTCGAAHQTCTHDTYSGGGACIPATFKNTCSNIICTTTTTTTTTTKPPTTTTTTQPPVTTTTTTPIPVSYVCSNSYHCDPVYDGSGVDQNACNAQCKAPQVGPCGDSPLFALAPAGIPVGGLCMVNRMIQLGLNLVLIAAIILAIVYLIWAGATWIMSEGDKQKLAQARQRVTLAIIGLVIIFVSFAVLKILQVLFGVG